MSVQGISFDRQAVDSHLVVNKPAINEPAVNEPAVSEPAVSEHVAADACEVRFDRVRPASRNVYDGERRGAA